MYDIRWPAIRDSLRAQQASDWRQADAVETEKRRATEEKAKTQKGNEARQECLRCLYLSKSRYESETCELRRAVRKLAADLKRLQDRDDKDVRKEKEQKSWWTYIASPFSAKVEETDEQKQARETARLHRLASKTIKGIELRGSEAKLRRQQDALQDVDSKIAAEKKNAEDEARAQARQRESRMDQEARNRAQQEMRESRAKVQKEQAERAAKAARDAQAAGETQEARERASRELQGRERRQDVGCKKRSERKRKRLPDRQKSRGTNILERQRLRMALMAHLTIRRARACTTNSGRRFQGATFVANAAISYEHLPYNALDA